MTGYRRIVAFVIGVLTGAYPILFGGEPLDQASVEEIVLAITTLSAAGLTLWSKLQPDDA
jgi:hypothetical protein